MRSWLLLCLFVVTSGFASAAFAVLPGEVLSDTKLENRAREISRELRCVVCQNQSIDDSDAPLAGDMRVLVRQRLVAGDTDQEVKDYLVARYGNFVLLSPPVQKNTLALWFGPFVLLIIGFIGFAIFLRKHRNLNVADTPALTEEEAERLKSLKLDTSS